VWLDACVGGRGCAGVCMQEEFSGRPWVFWRVGGGIRVVRSRNISLALFL